jgi:hypothetical protein
VVATKKLTKSAGASAWTDFRAQIRDRERDIAAATDEALTDALSPREQQFIRDQERLWVEAQWLSALNQFANGKPLRQQSAIELAVYGTFLAAINKRAYGGGEDADKPDW